MPAHACADDGSSFHVEGGEERRGSMPLIIVGASLDLPRTHRQERLRPVERLNLAFFIDAQHEGALGWRQVKPDDVGELLHELAIAREFEGLHSVRL